MNQRLSPDFSLVTAVIEGGNFLGTFDKEGAARAAKAYNGTVRPYGIHLDRIDPVTKEAISYKKIDGFSVWL